MNILPKKRWHVRTKDNIARVRKDEAEARVVEENRKKQLEIAESEARINFLRSQSGAEESVNCIKDTSGCKKLEHVDLFADFKTHIKTTNKDLEKEKKEEQEKYEKQIGYLTYLGQDTNEALKQQSWYEIAPKRRHMQDTEINEKELKLKHTHDPLTLIKAFLPEHQKQIKKLPIEFVVETKVITTDIDTEPLKNRHKKTKKHKKEKHKKNKKYSSKEKYKLSESITESQQNKSKMLENLRKERLRREAIERARQEAILKPKEPTVEIAKNIEVIATPRLKQKYNTQFNPEIAKQNM